MNRQDVRSYITLAWLLNVGGWMAASVGRSGSAAYFLKERPAFVLEVTTLAATVITACVLFFVLRRLDRHPGWGRGVREVVLLAAASLGVLRAVVHVGLIVRSSSDTILYRIAAFAIVFSVLSFLTFALVYHRARAAKAVSGLLAGAAPLVLVNTGTVAWMSANLALRTDYSDAAPSSSSVRTGAAKRVVWAIFDEMDEGLAFERRPLGLQLPELDRLRATSVYATNAKPPGTRTLWVIPSLTTGRRVRFARPLGSSALELEFADGSGRRKWRDVPNVFSAAHEMGISTAVVGWYHPYCRTFGDLLANCYWQPLLDVNDQSRQVAFADRLGLRGYLLPYVGFALGARRFIDPFGLSSHEARLIQRDHAAVTAALWKESLSVVADPRFNFVYIHIPLPHPPGLRVASNGLEVADELSYTGNFVLVDRLIGEWRQALERAQLWDESTLIVTSDHSLRPFWRFQPFWTEADSASTQGSALDSVPLMVKMPGQEQSIGIGGRIGTEALYGLVVGVLRGEVTDAGSAAARLRARST